MELNEQTNIVSLERYRLKKVAQTQNHEFKRHLKLLDMNELHQEVSDFLERIQMGNIKEQDFLRAELILEELAQRSSSVFNLSIGQLKRSLIEALDQLRH